MPGSHYGEIKKTNVYNIPLSSISNNLQQTYNT